ncbi:N-acetylmuramoyl-L-alanine amidase [Ureibacillus chungkukjangi]|uniref:N-acetylmuramoyl-L-alanine amidase n=1 Tax=Ureibacillus chungkukjangi TaxID=1202712 RepID=UPI00203A96BB|nr:N-acetylmuramoyl-L-alanine amidase [Ureibacillus chungkukjangi]MCM3387360.1 N-acetylmuramoyl-L-alanine amidase [Ureibacillus chungkukjangi]
MTYKIALDDGHGDNGVTPGKRTPKFVDGTFMYENTFNKVVVKYLDEILRRCGFKTILVAPTDADTPLATRVKSANNAKVDAYVSIHANAATGNWGNAQGIETFVGASAMSKKLANNVHNQLIKGTAQKNRGVKDGTHLYVIRNTIAPAILVECAFMDNLFEAQLLLSDSFRRECATEIAKGICETFNVKYLEESKIVNKPSPSTSTTKDTARYRIKSGAYGNQAQAEAAKVKIGAKGIANVNYIQVFKDGNVWRWLTGTYVGKSNAEGALKKIKDNGIASVGYVVAD